MLYDWRYRHRLGQLCGDVRFTPLIAIEEAAVPLPPNSILPSSAVMTIEVADRGCVSNVVEILWRRSPSMLMWT